MASQPRSGPRARHPSQGLIDRACPDVDPDQVLTHRPEGLHTPVAVDEDPARGLAGLRDRHHRHQLTLLAHSARQSRQVLRVPQTQRRKALNQTVQIDTQDVFHGYYASSTGALCPSSPLFATTAKTTVTIGKHMHFHDVRVHIGNPRPSDRNQPVSP